jgi:hypothetical protein
MLESSGNLDGSMNEQVANLPVTGGPRALAQSLAGYREPSIDADDAHVCFGYKADIPAPPSSVR